MCNIAEINMAISIIRDVCVKHPNCDKDNCPLHDGVDCTLNTGEPEFWKDIEEED